MPAATLSCLGHENLTQKLARSVELCQYCLILTGSKFACCSIVMAGRESVRVSTEFNQRALFCARTDFLQSTSCRDTFASLGFIIRLFDFC